MPKGKHRGTCVSLWLSDEELEKVEALMTSSGQTRTKVIKDLLAGRQLPDHSLWKTCKRLASIGGYIKKFVDNGEHGNAYKLGCEIIATAREIEKSEKARIEGAG